MNQELIIEMDKKSVMIRGRIIGLYTGVEFLIDDIIKNTLFNDKEDFAFYSDILGLSDKLNGKVKSKIIKYCLEKYDKRNGSNTESVRERLDNLTNKRDKMAHWILDTSEEGMDLYSKKGQLRFIKNKKEKEEQEVMSLETVQNLEKSLNDIMTELIQVQATYTK